ncbi:hypothetical protein [Methyloferula stellata]|uniref:hypothetical protein n=1 Tax=Methyloferula stellata TaxID=876270 RepID=UPI000378157A|nr:hypothetical protein [Methyloferula stellata]
MASDEQALGPGSITAVRLLFSRGDGTFLVEREEGYSLFSVERFCWMNAGSMFEELGEFEGAEEMQSWPTREAFDAWIALAENRATLAGHVENLIIGYVGPHRLSDNAGA